MDFEMKNVSYGSVKYGGPYSYQDTVTATPTWSLTDFVYDGLNFGSLNWGAISTMYKIQNPNLY